MNRANESLETILTFTNRDLDSYSVIMSTMQIPDMDSARGTTVRRTIVGRRRIRLGSFALAALLTMHCRVASAAVSSGYFVFVMFLVGGIAGLSNPLRHFEVYLGQWSISGPGRAFRALPMLDGIGIAMCMNCILRAVFCICVAAMCGIYVIKSLPDSQLPFQVCRNLNLEPYPPAHEYHKDHLQFYKRRIDFNANLNYLKNNTNHGNSKLEGVKLVMEGHYRGVCEEGYYKEAYPPIYKPPAYNYFYIELTEYRDDHSLFQFNWNMLIATGVIWAIIWMLVIYEKCTYGRMIWNNMHPWLIIVPVIWSIFLMGTAFSHVDMIQKIISPEFRIDSEGLFITFVDALNIGLYIHSASTGTELIHGKGLNHYASGHIDNMLNTENIWHSAFLLVLTACHASGTSICAIADCIPSVNTTTGTLRETSLWVLPMYSQCTTQGYYSHFTSGILFSGLTISYTFVGYTYLKTALHTIFEYRVKLVFYEMVIVVALLLGCMLLSVFGSTTAGLIMLESMETWLIGLGMLIVCLLELVAMLYAYRSTDFTSDMNAASEDNACAPRIQYQLQIIPFVIVIILIMRAHSYANSTMPTNWLIYGLLPVLGLVLAVLLRGLYNFYVYAKPNRRHT